MRKQSKIKNLLVIPIMASAILLASPALAANPDQTSQGSVRHKTTVSSAKAQVAGTVSRVNGTIIVVTAKNGLKYTVDASLATIMEASDKPDVNPAIITTSNIKVGDAIVVRGVVNNTEINE